MVLAVAVFHANPWALAVVVGCGLCALGILAVVAIMAMRNRAASPGDSSYDEDRTRSGVFRSIPEQSPRDREPARRRQIADSVARLPELRSPVVADDRRRVPPLDARCMPEDEGRQTGMESFTPPMVKSVAPVGEHRSDSLPCLGEVPSVAQPAISASPVTLPSRMEPSPSGQVGDGQATVVPIKPAARPDPFTASGKTNSRPDPFSVPISPITEPIHSGDGFSDMPAHAQLGGHAMVHLDDLPSNVPALTGALPVGVSMTETQAVQQDEGERGWDDDETDDAPIPTQVFFGFFDGIVDSATGAPPKPQRIPKPLPIKRDVASSQGGPAVDLSTEERRKINEAAGEPMLRRPDRCPLCGIEPHPDYYAENVEDGVIWTCRDCESIVYVEPAGIAHRYLGKTYHAACGKDFAPPVTMAQKSVIAAVPSDIAVDIDGFVDTTSLFCNIVDHN